MPFNDLENSQWLKAFVILRGTHLSIHQRNSPNILSKSVTVTPGKVLKTYTLQYAEIGVASDLKKFELVPRSPVIALLPQAMQNRMKQTESHLFEAVRQFHIRLRVETDQIVLRFKTWEERRIWMDKLCAGIDIAPSLDERTEPRYHTLPRRGRHRHVRTGRDSSPGRNASLVPEHGGVVRESLTYSLPSEESDEPEHDQGGVAADPEADDLDMSVVLTNRDCASSPSASTPEIPAPLARSINLSHETRPMATDWTRTFAVESLPPNQRRSDDVGDGAGQLHSKLDATIQLDAAQEARYRRRCMPSLMRNARRAGDVVFHNGACWKIDWQSKMLQPHPQPPPRYETMSSVANSDLVLDAGSGCPLNASRSSTTVNEGAAASVKTVVEAKFKAGQIWRDVGFWGRRLRTKKTVRHGLSPGDGESGN